MADPARTSFHWRHGGVAAHVVNHNGTDRLLVQVPTAHIWATATWLDGDRAMSSCVLGRIFWSGVLVTGREAEYRDLRLARVSVHPIHATRILALVVLRNRLDTNVVPATVCVAAFMVQQGLRQLSAADLATLALPPNDTLHRLYIPDGAAGNNHVAVIVPDAAALFYEQLVLGLLFRHGSLEPAGFLEILANRFVPATRAANIGFLNAIEALSEGAGVRDTDSEVRRALKITTFATTKERIEPTRENGSILGDFKELVVTGP